MPVPLLVCPAGVYITSQFQALHVGTPLLERNPLEGMFKLTIGVEKCTDLMNFSPSPLMTPQTVIKRAGELEIGFPSSDDLAFDELLSK